MKKALFIDFEDSFSYNVVQELTVAGLAVDVIHWLDFSDVTDHDLLVLGPGPGHPDDYFRIFEVVKAWQATGKKIFAVCLGHQILWRLKGNEVKRSQYPLHGQKIELHLDSAWQAWLKMPQTISVQRYNSLAVMVGEADSETQNFVENGEIIMSRGPQFISYQFHPESMGTKCRQSFFSPIFRDLL